jgi:predicted nucleic acid-binding protein
LLTIDASVWVAADTADEPAHTEARELLRTALGAGLTLHQPMLTLVEVAAAVTRRTHDPELGAEAGRSLLETPGLTLHSLDLEAAAEAAALAGRLMLRAADAIYAATALHHGTALITLDLELRERASPLVEALEPTEWLSRRQP